jgi:hypothetical protein
MLAKPLKVSKYLMSVFYPNYFGDEVTENDVCQPPRACEQLTMKIYPNQKNDFSSKPNFYSE